MMIQLFPSPAPQDDPGGLEPKAAVAAEARPAPGERPWVYTNMIASVDGGTAVDGLSGALGGPGDKAMFAALRAVADVILVGASTARQERYRVPIQPAEVVAARQARGQAPHPRLAIVTRSLDLEPDLPLFDDEHRPYVVTVASSPADRRSDLADRAELIIAGDDGVELALAMRQLAGLGAGTVLSEGGPSLNGQLIEAGLIDEWNLSISPHLLGADSRRAAVGPVPDGPPQGMRLARVWSDDDFLFCRWVRDRGRDGGEGTE